MREYCCSTEPPAHGAIEEVVREGPAHAGVLLYTDGLTEARHDGKQFGLDG